MMELCKEKAAPLGSGFEEAQKLCARSSLGLLDVVDGDLAAAAVLGGVEGDLLTFNKIAHAGALESGGVDEHVLAAIVRLDEAEALHVVVKFHSAHDHGNNLSRLMWMHVSEGTRSVTSTRFVDGLERASERAPGNANSETARLSGQSR